MVTEGEKRLAAALALPCCTHQAS